MVTSKIDDNIFKYLKWRKDLSFNQDPFNIIDGLIISQLSFLEEMIKLASNPIPLKEALEPYLKLTKKDKYSLGMIIPSDCLKLGKELAKAPRFKDCLISNFVKEFSEEVVEQFCALTFHINDDLMVIAFQGTDDSLIGWQENFNMVIKFPIPAQEKAALYVDKMHQMYPNKKIITVGHSKGGNLSAYTALYSESRKYITRSINYDGPGFELGDIPDEIIEENKQRILNIFPSRSTVGMIFDHYGKTKSIKSNENGLYQHNPFSWIIEGNKFIEQPASKDSLKFHDDLNTFVYSLSDDDRERLSQAFDRYVKACGAKTLSELSKPNSKMLPALKEIGREERKHLWKFITLFIQNRML